MKANTPSATEEMLAELGSKFVVVWFLVRGDFIDERHVEDPTTIQTTTKMSAERLGAKVAVYQIDDEWEMVRYRDLTFRRYPTKEAAMMAGIHLAG